MVVHVGPLRVIDSLTIGTAISAMTGGTATEVRHRYLGACSLLLTRCDGREGLSVRSLEKCRTRVSSSLSFWVCVLSGASVLQSSMPPCLVTPDFVFRFTAGRQCDLSVVYEMAVTFRVSAVRRPAFLLSGWCRHVRCGSRPYRRFSVKCDECDGG